MIVLQRSVDLPHRSTAAVRQLLEDAFRGDFADEDWAHALGGVHVTASQGGVTIGHAAVVRRRIDVDGTAFETGYVEAVAVAPEAHGRGVGTALMEDIGAIIVATYEMGCLGTGEHHFYERLGWERWQGVTFVRGSDGPQRTPDDDDAIMVLRFGASSGIDITADISCDERAGDDW